MKLRVIMRYSFFTPFLLFILFSGGNSLFAQTTRVISGVVITARNEVVPNAIITVKAWANDVQTISDAEGKFKLDVPMENIAVRITGKNIKPQSRIVSNEEDATNLQIVIEYVVPPIHEELVISASSLEPTIERRNEKVYENTLFSRDDQVFQTLDAGINAGQHEGGGKSLEIRRFGFNLDHGGVNGGLKVLVDNFQQNQGTQGHGQGYLGNLKSLSPELIKDVDIINGPFSAEYGDFSGLGVVQIRLREDLPQQFTARIQGGSFNTFRTFLAYSPKIKNTSSFFAFEHSQTDGPFKNPLDYKRDNVTGNFTYNLTERRAFGVKFNAGRNDFVSSGQIPLDLVNNGRLDRFGFIDPDNGGKVQLGNVGVYFRDENAKGRIFKFDSFVARSLFDLWSNFTFNLVDPIYGDEIQQHDSRLQEGANAQFLQPVKFSGMTGLFTAGANFHANQINVGLYPSIGRNPNRKFKPENINNPDILLTSAQANVNNYATYVQQSLDFFDGHLNLGFGLRYDYFTFDVTDKISPAFSGKESQGKFQPKFNAAYLISHKFPLTLNFNYGRGISSQDARGVVRNPDSPKLATTDFYQAGTSYSSSRFSGVFDVFLIDRSNEQVYIPDDGSIEFAGPSRASGVEFKTSVKLNNYFNFNGGLTQVLNAFYRGTNPRVFVDSAPHLTVNGAFTLNNWRGFSGSLRYRHINNYRLDGLDETIRASGFDVVDFNATKQLNKRFDLNFSIDNLTNKHYFETQNFFESRVRPTDLPIERIHATPGYPITFTAGITFRLGTKN